MWTNGQLGIMFLEMQRLLCFGRGFAEHGL